MFPVIELQGSGGFGWKPRWIHQARERQSLLKYSQRQRALSAFIAVFCQNNGTSLRYVYYIGYVMVFLPKQERIFAKKSVPI